MGEFPLTERHVLEDAAVVWRNREAKTCGMGSKRLSLGSALEQQPCNDDADDREKHHYHQVAVIIRRAQAKRKCCDYEQHDGED
jgi:hypothetical protein